MEFDPKRKSKKMERKKKLKMNISKSNNRPY